MDCEAPLAGGGEVRIQLIYALGATFIPSAGGAASYNPNPRGGNSGRPLSMILCGITLLPLAEELRVEDPGLLSPFYVDDAAFDGSARRSAQILKLLMKRGPGPGIFPQAG